MTDSAFKWSMWYKGRELNSDDDGFQVMSSCKNEVWVEFIRWRNFMSGKSHTNQNRIMFEQIGYSVQESSWWRSANVRSS